MSFVATSKHVFAEQCSRKSERDCSSLGAILCEKPDAEPVELCESTLLLLFVCESLLMIS